MYLFADNTQRFWTRMDQNYRLKYERLLQAKDPRWHIVDINQPAVEFDIEKYKILLVGVFAALRSQLDQPNAFIPDEWFKGIGKRCVMVEDMHPRLGQPLSSLFNGKYNYLVATYDVPALTQLVRECTSVRKHWVVPHHIDTGIYRYMNLPKLYDVVVYGNTDASTYPFRHRLSKLLMRSKLRVRVIDCPDVRYVDESLCGAALAGIINQSLLAIATPSRHDYLLAKYFEIAACGTLVAGQMATQGKEIWKDRYLRLEPEMSDQVILERMTQAVANEESLIAGGLAMGEVIGTQFSLDCYIQRLNEVLEEMAAHEG